MTAQYSSTKICPYNKQGSCADTEKLALEPGKLIYIRISVLLMLTWIEYGGKTDLEEILVTSKDYDELAYVWSQWRIESARPMRDEYEMYVELSNKAAQANGTTLFCLW